MIDYAVLWYGLAVTGLVVALGMAVRDGMQARVRHFDVPILDAINYLARTIPHSYRDSGSGRTSLLRTSPQRNVRRKLAGCRHEGRVQYAQADQCSTMQAAYANGCRGSTQPQYSSWSEVLACQLAGGVSRAACPHSRRVSHLAKRHRWIGIAGGSQCLNVQTTVTRRASTWPAPCSACSGEIASLRVFVLVRRWRPSRLRSGLGPYPSPGCSGRRLGDGRCYGRLPWPASEMRVSG